MDESLYGTPEGSEGSNEFEDVVEEVVPKAMIAVGAEMQMIPFEDGEETKVEGEGEPL
jgi:hypothetical protein